MIGRRRQRGFALISVIIGISLVLLTLLVASTLAQLGSRLITLQLTYQGQALNTANAGLIEGLDYFRRQPSTATTFAPTRNLAATPPVDDTDAITTPASITRDFLISSPGRIWGHYSLTVGNAAAGTGVIDLSTNRRGPSAAAGGIWQLESTGVIYVKNGTGAYNVSPNKVIASKTARSEISKLAFTPPTAALSITSGTKVTLTCKSRLVGGSGGFGLATVSGGTAAQNACGTISPTLSGTPNTGGTSASAISINGVFGGSINSLSDLAAVADVVTTAEAGVPNPVPMQIVYLNKANAVFNAATPLVGSGVLVVNGNLSLSGQSRWNGLIYVIGTYSQTDPVQVSGAVVLQPTAATALVNGTNDFAEIYYDRAMMTQVSTQIGQYRFSRNAYVPCPATDPLCQKRLSGNREIGY